MLFCSVFLESQKQLKFLAFQQARREPVALQTGAVLLQMGALGLSLYWKTKQNQKKPPQTHNLLPSLLP